MHGKLPKVRWDCQVKIEEGGGERDDVIYGDDDTSFSS